VEPSKRFKQHHGRLIEQFETLRDEILDRNNPDLTEFVEFLTNQLLPHARAEEEELYNLVDQRSGTELATASMRRDHEELEKRIESFSSTDTQTPDAIPLRVSAFSALLLNHFHKEEAVLLPFLDEHLNRDEFNEVLERVHGAEQEHRGR